MVMLSEKSNLKAIFKRLKLFKELEPDFKIDKVFYLTEPIEYDFKILVTGAYIVSNPFVSSKTGLTIVTIVDLERKIQGHKMGISDRTRNQGFTCWRIKETDFKRKFKIAPFEALHNFLYKGEQND